MKINNYIKITLILLTIVTAISCQTKTFDTKEELLTYIKNPDNGYFHTKTVNGVTFSLLHRPTDLLVSQEISEHPTQREIDSLRNKYDKYLYFNLSISKNGQELLSTVPKDRNEFGAMVNTLAFGMRDYVHLVTNKKDTIEMADYVYPRMYGMSNKTTMMLVYPKDEVLKSANKLTLGIRELVQGTGDVKFSEYLKLIIKQPNLLF